LIRTSATSLLTLINNLLDFSKIEADKMVLDIEPFDLRALLEQLVTFHLVTGKSKGLAVTADIAATLAPRYQGDAYRLRQVLVNLLGNAIKFTEQGTVTLRVLKQASTESSDLLRFEVEDSGVGIAEGSIGKLFQPFSQVDSSSTRRYGGSGLGLSICARLIKLMRGDFGVQSEYGHGATFWFTVSLPRTTESKESREIPSKTEQLASPLLPIAVLESQPMDAESGLRLLIVDDEETNRVVMGETFRHTGVEIVFASNGQEAINACRHHRFNLIFMDCQMPEVDGFTATKTILAEAAQRQYQAPAIIALTADVTSAAQDKCREVGMVDYLAKPIDFSRLQAVLTHWFPELQLSVIPVADAAGKGSEEESRAQVVVNPFVLERLCEHVGNITPAVQVFLRSLDRRLTELEKAVQNRDALEINKVAHTMKGSSSQFGAEDLAHLCSLAENMGKSGNLQQIERIFQQIVQATQQVKHFFAEHLE
jgi:CheY-like chemotaxis protein/HPt (histidine-containing phosphotransfer) domain-containing protein